MYKRRNNNRSLHSAAWAAIGGGRKVDHPTAVPKHHSLIRGATCNRLMRDGRLAGDGVGRVGEKWRQDAPIQSPYPASFRLLQTRSRNASIRAGTAAGRRDFRAATNWRTAPSGPMSLRDVGGPPLFSTTTRIISRASAMLTVRVHVFALLRYSNVRRAIRSDSLNRTITYAEALHGHEDHAWPFREILHGVRRHVPRVRASELQLDDGRAGVA